MYRWIVYLHILAVFIFLLAHGGSASAVFRLRRETERSRLAALLDLSSAGLGLSYASLLVLLVAGILLGFVGRWWGQGWIWISILLLVLTLVGMYVRSSIPMNRLRQAAGLPYFDGRRAQPAATPASEEVIWAAAAGMRPIEVAAMGVVPIAIILWLMMFKPF
jgi:hypothetical protein